MPTPGIPDKNRRPIVLEQARADADAVEDFGKAVHVQHGKFTASIPAAVVASLITAAGMYFGRPAPATPEDIQRATKDNTQAIAKVQVDQTQNQAAVNQRLMSIETQNSLIVIRLEALAQRLPPK